MSRFLTIPALIFCVISTGVYADQDLARGKFLVASEELRGPHFSETVILLLQYDETGAGGLIVNRPMEVTPAEAMPQLEGMDRYRGTLNWGGPVQVNTLRALLNTDAPPENALQIVDAVHMVPLDENLAKSTPDSAMLRFYVGYAGWAPGQLEGELAHGSWHILPATAELVFAKDPGAVWQKLVPKRQYRAAAEFMRRDPGY